VTNTTTARTVRLWGAALLARALAATAALGLERLGALLVRMPFAPSLSGNPS
jgi:hypothetical protein